jgi:hypothetical protein
MSRDFYFKIINVMKKVIYFLFAIGFCASLKAQTTIVCVGAKTSFSVNGSSRTKWNLRDATNYNNNTNIVNSDATLFFADGAFYPWDTKRTSGYAVKIQINSTSTTRIFKAEYSNYNFFGAYVGGGDFFIEVPLTIPAPIIAPVPGNPLTAQCGINITVTNPRLGATYNWSNGKTGNTVEYTSITPPASCIATCAVTPAPSNTGNIPPGFLDPIISLPSEITVCEGEFFPISASATQGCLGSSWTWSLDGLVSFANNTGSSTGGSTAFYSFNSAGTFTITASGTSGLPPFASAIPATTNVTVLAGGGFCSFLKGGGGKTESTALKARSSMPIGSATLFPNPVSEVLQLKELQDYNNLRVVDQYGKVLNTQPIVEGETAKSINVSQFVNGLYLIQFTNKTGEVTTKKFQVVH